MKKITLTLFILAAFIFSCKTKQTQAPTYDYEVQCLGTGKQGTQLVKIWGYGKNPTEAIEQAKMNAVHAILFKGVATGSPGCIQRPLVTNNQAEEQYKTYFTEFFAINGKYLKYVTLSTDGSIDPNDRLKVGKKYKIGVAVTVNSDALRSELEDKGIIKKLGSGF